MADVELYGSAAKLYVINSFLFFSGYSHIYLFVEWSVLHFRLYCRALVRIFSLTPQMFCTHIYISSSNRAFSTLHKVG